MAPKKPTLAPVPPRDPVRDFLRRDAAPHGAVERHEAPRDATEHHAAPHGAIERHMEPHDATQGHVAPDGAAERHEAPHDATKRHTAPHGAMERHEAPRAAGTAITFASGARKRRVQVYLDEGTAEGLTAWCSANRYSVSEAMEEAARTFLSERAAAELRRGKP